ncbi:alcohol dehydrogenase catalytic domain-containing protein [Pseudomonas fluorescens]|uniref:alcohol dehydrogenase catalytic domain-containing protein n=1 Tax=Pseudomonas fluorescens TaxID=294 RepID=UPI003D779018
MEWLDEPSPTCDVGQVRIRVAAAGLNRADLLQRAGFYPPPPGASQVLGLECSGVISEVGAGSSWQVGDRVCAARRWRYGRRSGGGCTACVAGTGRLVADRSGGIA